ncbi:MAG: hypothetical protein NTZ01_00470 [Verrucomicrobia bacterium]|nr:hypothetical protein [Verrucomicrobiota bacterium]
MLIPSLLILLLTSWVLPLQAEDTNQPVGRLPATPPTEATNPPVKSTNVIIVNQGIKIWKTGSPTNMFTVIGYETLIRQRGFENAANNIARGVLARKGNAAIVNSIVNYQRLNFNMNTQDERLDGIDVRYQIILLKP